jgi:glycosyltransferase involved in cell wall biosynthesis
MSTAHKVSVIIPVFDDADGLSRCLDRLREQDHPTGNIEIFVVDNGTGDEVRSCVEARPGVRYLREERPGSYAARNRGLSEASGTIIAFTDADCLPAADWVTRGVEAIQRLSGPGMVVGQVRIFFADPKRPTSVELFESVASFRQEEYVARWHFGATANVFTTAETLARVGTFDAEFRSLGDVEWGRRVFAAGLSQVYDHSVVVDHPARRHMGEFRRRAARMTGGFKLLAARSGMGRLELFRYALCGLVPLRHLFDFRSDSRLRGPVQRARVLGVSTMVVLVRFLELVRLRFGGEAGR